MVAPYAVTGLLLGSYEMASKHDLHRGVELIGIPNNDWVELSHALLVASPIRLSNVQLS